MSSKRTPISVIALAAASLAWAQTVTVAESKAAASSLELSPAAGSAGAARALGKRQRDEVEDGRPAKARRLDAAGTRSADQAGAPRRAPAAQAEPLAFANDSDRTWKVTIPELGTPFVLEHRQAWGAPVETTERLDPGKDLMIYIHKGYLTVTPVDPVDGLTLPFTLDIPADDPFPEVTRRFTWSLQDGTARTTRGWPDGKGSTDLLPSIVVVREAEGIEFHSGETRHRSWMTGLPMGRLRHHGR